MIFLFDIFKHKSCRLVFIVALAIISLLVPRSIFLGWLILLGIPFIVLSSMVVSCFIRLLRERIRLSKESGMSLLGIIATAFGFIALQMCSIGTLVCGVTLSFSIFGFILPGFLFHFIGEYSYLVLVLSIILQFISLYFMNCFKKVKSQK
ncbi:hypothetical protein KY334_07995 [Candidatus Woesearchaeota archaeon]|nr:hypothetical protein [Candidatus Woesearchaeota archaeon]